MQSAVKVRDMAAAAVDGAKMRQGVLVGTLDEVLMLLKQLLDVP